MGFLGPGNSLTDRRSRRRRLKPGRFETCFILVRSGYSHPVNNVGGSARCHFSNYVVGTKWDPAMRGSTETEKTLRVFYFAHFNIVFSGTIHATILCDTQLYFSGARVGHVFSRSENHVPPPDFIQCHFFLLDLPLPICP